MRPDEPVAEEVGGAGSWGPPSLLRGLVFFVLLLVVILVGRLTPLRSVLDDAEVWRARVDDGPLGVLGFVGATAVLMLVGIPRLAFCFLGGVLFGFAEGLAWSLVGTLLGAYGVFMIARWGGRGRWPRGRWRTRVRPVRTSWSRSLSWIWFATMRPTCISCRILQSRSRCIRLS